MDSRPRKTTLENFNEELAALDRPLEGDVEYYDERPQPRPRRWAGTSAVIIGTVFFAGAGVLFFSHPDPETIIAAAQAAAASAPQQPQPTAAPAEPVVVPAAVAEAPVAIASGPAAADETSTANASPKWRSPPSRAAWIKLRGASRRHR